MRKALIVGIVLLSSFVGYGVWKIVLKERIPLLSYKVEVEGVVGFAERLIEKNRPPGTNAAELKSGAEELRRRHHVLIDRASDTDKRRPSYRKTDEIVMQVEYAAQQPDSKAVIESRFQKALEAIRDVKSLLGTDQDQPQLQ
jgi:hypothetical protein